MHRVGPLMQPLASFAIILRFFSSLKLGSPTPLRIGKRGFPFVTVLPLSECLKREGERRGPERGRKTFNEARSEVR